MSNLKIIELIEDIDPLTRAPRIKVRARETKPRQFDINLKNATAEQINFLKKNVGAVLSLPTQEYFANGSYGLSMRANDEEFFILKPADSVQVSKLVEVDPVKTTFSKAG
ncbi:hypothetical protein [Methylobacter sp. S3L5C]|uniref:hypothetical protein n=1 Tax=Methylobacter sp. S3L5C TaxID=2839024 RepID=UPI001FAB7C03|nr:hypothetical protein [Methylobacter sp. S3L5C]UOA07518.1 hypothetical protein KKZ03_14750 [Methylobacter sp. S3L5C]